VIRVELRSFAKYVELCVSDTGLGIAPDHLPHIFDRFYRVPGIDQGQMGPERGLGLGLSFVAWIVKAHSGRIHVQSQPGKGTTFLVRLPKSDQVAADKESTVGAAAAESS
jgi:signal transduction histidine kinase